MARISTYPIDTSVNTSDFLIGTDSEDSNITKNYTIASIISLATSGGYINAAVDHTATTATTTVLDNFVPLEGTLVLSVSELWNVGTAANVNRIIYTGTSAQVTKITATVNITGTASEAMSIALFKSGVEIVGTRQNVAIAAAGVLYAAVSLQAVISLVLNDYITVGVMNIAAANPVTATNFNISAALV